MFSQVVTGTLTVKASGRNARDIDYTIAYKCAPRPARGSTRACNEVGTRR